MLFKAISPATNFAISLFPTYLSHPDVLDSLMGFFLALFNGLRAQIGPSLTEQTTQTFMTLLTREHLEETLLQEGSLGSRVVERFLCILQLLVQDGGDRSFLPSIISFVMNQIYPIVSKRPSPEIKAVLYELLFQLLLNNWRYFFPANILSHMDNDSNDPIENEVEFFNIMESFGHSFLQEDIAVFKQNLVALETLNSKHKLYSKIQFRSCMLYPFLQILLHALVQKSHDLLQEEICSSIYSMAAVDFAAYHQQFLPKFLASIQEELSGSQQAELVKNYKMVEDLPSFVQNIRQFMNDLRYFLILNKSVPAGSVKLS